MLSSWHHLSGNGFMSFPIIEVFSAKQRVYMKIHQFIELYAKDKDKRR